MYVNTFINPLQSCLRDMWVTQWVNRTVATTKIMNNCVNNYKQMLSINEKLMNSIQLG